MHMPPCFHSETAALPPPADQGQWPLTRGWFLPVGSWPHRAQSVQVATVAYSSMGSLLSPVKNAPILGTRTPNPTELWGPPVDHWKWWWGYSCFHPLAPGPCVIPLRDAVPYKAVWFSIWTCPRGEYPHPCRVASELVLQVYLQQSIPTLCLANSF